METLIYAAPAVKGLSLSYLLTLLVISLIHRQFVAPEIPIKVNYTALEQSQKAVSVYL